MAYIITDGTDRRAAESLEDATDIIMGIRAPEELAQACARWERVMERENRDDYMEDLLAQAFLGRARGLREELDIMIECEAGYGSGFTICGVGVSWEEVRE